MEKYQVALMMLSINIFLISMLLYKIIRFQKRMLDIMNDVIDVVDVMNTCNKELCKGLIHGGKSNDNKNARPED